MTADEIARILDVLGERLGPSGEYAFGLAVRYVLIDSAIWAGIAVIAIGVAVWLWRRAGRFSWDSDRDAARAVAFGVAALAGIVLAMSTSHVLNAEWHAISRLIGAVR